MATHGCAVNSLSDRSAFVEEGDRTLAKLWRARVGHRGEPFVKANDYRSRAETEPWLWSDCHQNAHQSQA